MSGSVDFGCAGEMFEKNLEVNFIYIWEEVCLITSSIPLERVGCSTILVPGGHTDNRLIHKSDFVDPAQW